MTSAISVDVENEFQDILREAMLLARTLDRFGVRAEPLDDATLWAIVGGLAAGCEKIYSGCERVMDLLARRIDGEAVQKTESWHAILLNRMAHPFPGVRPAVITEDCRANLDRFRAFRHRIRSSYGMNLDTDIVLRRAAELQPALNTFYQEVTAFLAAHDGRS